METNCKNCGATINPHYSMCEYCGTPYDVESTEKRIKELIKENERLKQQEVQEQLNRMAIKSIVKNCFHSH
jgi:predicted amidophosphoribosyltransferase